MVTTPLYDVFAVLVHVDEKISTKFIPVWVREELSKFVIEEFDSSVDRLLIESVETWIVTTRGSELRKCRHQDKDTVKRVVCQVNRRAMASPPKIDNIYHKISFNIEEENDYGLIIGKNGETVRKIQKDFPGVRVSLDKLRVTISAKSSENLCFIRSSIKAQIRQKLCLREAYLHHEMNFMESVFLDVVQEIDKQNGYRRQLIENKKKFDCKKRNPVDEIYYRKRAKGKKQAWTI